jgi:anthranilate/para-aminobenzoate synthase component II
MIVVVDNTRNQKVKMYFPKLIKFLDDNKTSYVIVNGDIDGLKDMKKLLNKKQDAIDGIILSGGPIMLDETSNIDDYICNLYCLKHLINIPILGICFGCQLINMVYGGNLYDMLEVQCTKLNIEGTDDVWRSLDGKAKFCCRYLPNCVPSKHLETLMYVTTPMNDKKLPCVIKHKKKNITGVMFHPEALHKTKKVLYDFLNN